MMIKILLFCTLFLLGCEDGRKYSADCVPECSLGEVFCDGNEVSKCFVDETINCPVLMYAACPEEQFCTVEEDLAVCHGDEEYCIIHDDGIECHMGEY